MRQMEAARHQLAALGLPLLAAVVSSRTLLFGEDSGFAGGGAFGGLRLSELTHVGCFTGNNFRGSHSDSPWGKKNGPANW